MASKNLWDLMYESRDIIKPHRRHLYALVLIFFLPISFSSFLLLILSNHSQTNSTLVFNILYSLLVPLFSNCGVITITYSAFHIFYNHPVNLTSAIKSICTSFFPLLATTIVSQLIIFSISLFYGFLLFLLIHMTQFFDLTISYSYSPYIMGFFAALPLLLVMVYLQVNWTLVPVIVVVESCWGLEPLRRSTRLIKGMKGVALSSLFFFGSFAGVFVVNILFMRTGSNGYGNNGNWVFVVLNWVVLVAYSYFIAMIMNANLVVNTVLYIHCKANHGEVVDEFGKDYVRLPSHDGNVSHVV